MQHFSISKAGFVLFDGKAVGTVFDASAREVLEQLIQGKPARAAPAKRKASSYKNDVGPNWMDRYMDPETGKKKKWNYKPARFCKPGLYRTNGRESEYETAMIARHGSIEAWQAARIAERPDLAEAA